METMELLWQAYSEEMTPEEFIETFDNEREDIRSAQVIPSRLGDSTFGKIAVVRRTPTYIRQALRSEHFIDERRKSG